MREIKLVIDVPSGTVARSDRLSIEEVREFFGIQLCLMKGGQVLEYFRTEDFYENDAGQISESEGDIMLEFQPRHVSIRRFHDLIFVTAADIDRCPTPTDLDQRTPSPIFKHINGRYTPFYIGFYQGIIGHDNQLHSMHIHMAPKYSMEEVQNAARAKGEGYDILYWPYWVYLQVISLFANGGTTRGPILPGFALPYEGSFQEYVAGLRVVRDDEKNMVCVSSHPNNPAFLHYCMESKFFPFDEGLVVDISGTDSFGFCPTRMMNSVPLPEKICTYGYSKLSPGDCCTVGDDPENLFATKVRSAKDVIIYPSTSRLLYF